MWGMQIAENRKNSDLFTRALGDEVLSMEDCLIYEILPIVTCFE